MPSGWLLFPPQSVDLTEDWAEYHAKYTFKDGTFTAERRLVIKRDKIPLADWDKYLAFRRSIFEDESRMEPIENSAAPPQGNQSVSFDSGMSEIRAELFQNMLPLRNVVTVLMEEPPASGDELTKAATRAHDALDAIEIKSGELAPTDANSLYWVQALAAGWCIRGWAALATNDLPTAENYLHAAWDLSQDQVSGYLLGRVLEAKHDKTAAAHQYELAYITGAHSVFGGFSPWDADIRQRIADAYGDLTGKELTATSLNHGAYTRSLQEELDKSTEVRSIVHTTKLTGDGYFVVAFEVGKPAATTFLGGDKTFASLLPVLRAHTFSPDLPSSSKARLLREVHLVCSPWAGCDAYLLLPGAVQLPARVIQVAAPTGREITDPCEWKICPSARRSNSENGEASFAA